VKPLIIIGIFRFLNSVIPPPVFDHLQYASVEGKVWTYV